jgi:hypothetical protein
MGGARTREAWAKVRERDLVEPPSRLGPEADSKSPVHHKEQQNPFVTVGRGSQQPYERILSCKREDEEAE